MVQEAGRTAAVYPGLGGYCKLLTHLCPILLHPHICRRQHHTGSGRKFFVRVNNDHSTPAEADLNFLCFQTYHLHLQPEESLFVRHRTTFSDHYPVSFSRKMAWKVLNSIIDHLPTTEVVCRSWTNKSIQQSGLCGEGRQWAEILTKCHRNTSQSLWNRESIMGKAGVVCGIGFSNRREGA